MLHDVQIASRGEESGVSFLKLFIPWRAGDNLPGTEVCRLACALCVAVDGLLHSDMCGSRALQMQAACWPRGCGGRE